MLCAQAGGKTDLAFRQSSVQKGGLISRLYPNYIRGQVLHLLAFCPSYTPENDPLHPEYIRITSEPPAGWEPHHNKRFLGFCPRSLIR